MKGPNSQSSNSFSTKQTMYRRRQVLTALGTGSLFALHSFSTISTAKSQAQPEIVVRFQPPNLPENMAIDADGNIFLSMAVTGDLVKITPSGNQSTVASVRPGNGLLLGHVYDSSSTPSRSYALLNSRTANTHGIWELPHQSSREPRQVMQFSPDTVLNDLVIGPDGSTIYISTARATQTGEGGGREQYSISENGYYWATGFPDQPTLTKRTPQVTPAPSSSVDLLSLAGLTGITIHNGYLYMVNPHGGQLLRSQLTSSGEPGETEVVAEAPALQGGDGLTVGDANTLYVAVPIQNQIVRIRLDQQQVETVIATDAFDFPSDVQAQVGTQTLYICNAALQTFWDAQQKQQGQQNPAPSVMKVELRKGG